MVQIVKIVRHCGKGKVEVGTIMYAAQIYNTSAKVCIDPSYKSYLIVVSNYNSSNPDHSYNNNLNYNYNENYNYNQCRWIMRPVAFNIPVVAQHANVEQRVELDLLYTTNWCHRRLECDISSNNRWLLLQYRTAYSRSVVLSRHI